MKMGWQVMNINSQCNLRILYKVTLLQLMSIGGFSSKFRNLVNLYSWARGVGMMMTYHKQSHKWISSVWRSSSLFLAPTRGSEISEDSKKEPKTEVQIRWLGTGSLNFRKSQIHVHISEHDIVWFKSINFKFTI